jgi:uncharacterized protein (TIGR02246 family)
MLITTALALSLAAAAPAPDSAEMKALARQIDAAWNAHDSDSHILQFAEDGSLLTPSGKYARGRDAIRPLVGGKGPTGQTTSRSTVNHVQELSKGLFLVDLTQKLKGPGTKIMGMDTARVVLVVRRAGETWKLVAVRPFPQPRA